MKGFLFLYALLLILVVSLTQCNKKETTTQDTLFKLISSDSSGIEFNNTITTNDSINILQYEYLYNGGGVGIGDFNNDGLPDIFFTGNMVPCKIYLNQGKLKFKDITSSSGINTTGVWAYGVTIIDINQDGWDDIYISAGGIGNKDAFPNKLYINQKDLTFKEASAEYGLDDAGESIQSIFFDYDNDGDLDMYLLTGGGFEHSAITPRPIMKDGSNRNTDRLYRNDLNPDTKQPFFTDVSAEAGIREEGFGLGVSILDVNEDGWLDIYVTNDYLSPDLLYVNNRDGTFTDKALEYFKHTSHFAMGHDIGDVNNDGLMDIVAVDMLPEDHYRRKLMFGPNQYDRFYFAVNQGYGYQYMRNTLQLNNGNGSFSEIGQLAGIDKTDWSWSALMADFDNDGYQDIFITNGFGKDVTDLDFVKFRSEVANLDKNKRLRALGDSLKTRPGIKIANYVYKNNGDYTFQKKSDEWGFTIPSYSNGVAYVDLDLDGDLDLVINNIDEKAFLYQNTLVDKATAASNYLRIQLIGPSGNRKGIGSHVKIKNVNQFQVRLQNTTRGFISAVEDHMHFGLGSTQLVDTILVTWWDGRVNEVYNVKSNQTIKIDHSTSTASQRKHKENSLQLFSPLPSTTLSYRHEENEFNDFNYQPLLPHKLSRQGPGIAVGDVNGDGLEDLYVGGAYRKPGAFLLQGKNGTFTRQLHQEDFECEDIGCLLFDVDNDGDLDLYVVSGGTEYHKDHKNYIDRLYRNDGSGVFTKDADALPAYTSSGSCVVAGDFDQDGDLDLFVGGRLIPGQYPSAPQSYILRNDNGKFTDVTGQLAPAIKNLGMVTAALWTDVNNDSLLDLIITGEAMPICIFINTNGVFNNATAQSGLENTEGFWNSLVAGDFDNDGDTDYVAGNLGLNSPYKASVSEPLTMYYADYDNNGSIEPFIGYYEKGINYPIASLDILTQQVPMLKKHILFYRDYAKASMEQLVEMTGKKDFTTLYCRTFQTSLIENLGNGKFQVRPLSIEAQMGPVFGLLAGDINADGNLDILAVGNSYGAEVIAGRYDALTGITLLGDGKNNFTHLPSRESGFFVDGDAKAIIRIRAKEKSLIGVTQNNDSIKTFQLKNQSNKTVISPAKNETTATVILKDGRKRKVELAFGTTYLSQSSRSIAMTQDIKEIELYDYKGKLVRTVRNE